jgi:WD40 repeat protein
MQTRGSCLVRLLIRTMGVALCAVTLLLSGISGCFLLGSDSNDGPNAIPIASAGNSKTVKTNVEVIFNGVGADEDGKIVLYEWDFDGDSTFDWTSDQTGITSYAYKEVSTYTATFRVTDNDGATGSSDVRIVVVRGELPLANAGGPYTIRVNSPLSLVGTGTDPDGTISLYEWDFDGDGEFDWESSTTGSTTHEYAAVGDYTATLRVTDNDGIKTEAEAQVTVTNATYDPVNVQYERTLIGHSDRVNAVAITPDGKYVVSGSSDNTIQISSLSDGSHVRTLTGSNSIYSIALTSDGQHVISGGYKRIDIWRLSDGIRVRTISDAHPSMVDGVAVSPDGQYIVSGGYNDNTVKIWRLSDGSLVRTLTGHTDYIESIVVSPDGQYIVSGSSDATVKIWRLSDGSLVRTLTDPGYTVMAVGTGPDGLYLVCGGIGDGHLWRMDNWAHVSTLQTSGTYSDPIESIVVSADGKYIIGGTWEEGIQIWDLSDGSHLRTLPGHTDWISSVAVSPDGQYIVSGSHDETVRIWRVP